MGNSKEDDQDDDGFEIPEMTDEQEIHIALGYLANEAKSIGMPMVSHLIGAAMEAVELYDPQIKYRVNVYDKVSSSTSEGEEFDNLLELLTEDEKVGNC